MFDLVIIGSGPAGISAGIYAKRANMKVLIVSKHQGSIKTHHKYENYYGFDTITGEELMEKGIQQAKKLNIEMVEDEVVGIEYTGDYVVKTTQNSFTTKAIIIATGGARKIPNIKGLKEKEGRGVSYCALCDGFFYRQKTVGVIGNGEYAYHEAKELANIGVNVTIYTNGLQPEFQETDLPVVTEKILEIKGAETVEAIATESHEQAVSGLFIAIGVAGGFDFAKTLGAQIENNKIVVDENMATNIPGLYAAGDVTGGMLQVAKAVYEGAKAATEAIKFIRKK